MTKADWCRSVAAVLVFCVLGIVFFRRFEHGQIYHPFRQFEEVTSQHPFQEVVFETTDQVKLHGWFYSAATNSARRDRVILICHGNAGNVSHRQDSCDALLSTGLNVFVFDYRGYGRSEGRPDEQGTYEDAQSAYRWLRGQNFAGTNIIAYGESLGGAIATELALREVVGGVILQSTFTSISDVGTELFPWLPVRWLSRIAYDTRSKLPQLRVPVLVMHSRGDEIIAFLHGERNFASANEPKLFWELKGEHNDSLSGPENFVRGVEKFLAILDAPDRSQGTAKLSPEANSSAARQ
jgi:fermentation-respiration switch protein FrsA (DUF1100 family)